MLFNKVFFNWSLSQINQVTSILFAHCILKDKDTYEQSTPFCKCRDYFNDLIIKNQSKETFTIYGFVFDITQKKQRDEDHTLFALSIPDYVEYNNFIKNIIIYLPKIELTNKIKPYELIIPKNSNSILIIKADKYWQSHPLILSFFTFILRCFCYPLQKNKNDLYTNVENSDYKHKSFSNEINYIKKLNHDLLLFFQNNLKQIIPEDYQQPIYTEDKIIFHDQSGFFNFLKHNDLPRIIRSHQKLKENFIKLYNSCQVDVNPVTPS